MQPAALRQALSQAPTAFTKAPSSRARWAPSPLRKEHSPQGSDWREQRGHGTPLQGRGMENCPYLSDREVASCSLLSFSPCSADSWDPVPPTPALLTPPPALVGTSGSLQVLPVYLQSASGWVPAMDSGMTVACWTEVWVATPVSCCQAGGSRICWVPLGHACCRQRENDFLTRGIIHWVWVVVRAQLVLLIMIMVILPSSYRFSVIDDKYR